MSTADEIKERINELPKGSISRKQVNGKTYFYHRWHEDGKLKEKYIPEENHQFNRGVLKDLMIIII